MEWSPLPGALHLVVTKTYYLFSRSRHLLFFEMADTLPEKTPTRGSIAGGVKVRGCQEVRGEGVGVKRDGRARMLEA